MLRPATPLAVLFLAAFVLLLLSTLSTPIIKAIPLASWKGATFGVWGFCEGNNCSGIGIGYSYAGLTEGNSSSDFSLPTSTRHSLSSILIVHPVAAFLCLVCFALSVAAHFHAPSHSPRYLLALLIFTIPTVLVTLLAFLVDILVFVPHVSWGGWIVLASTILIIASMVLTCAMRRTLVSRKARKKRIAENAEMSGQNYYEQRAHTDMMMDRNAPPPSSSSPYSVVNLPKAESPPPMPNSISPISDKGAEYATFDLQKTNSDDRTPLKFNDSANGSPSRDRSGSTNGGWMGPGMGAVNDHYGPRQDRRDQFGNPLPPRNEPYDPYYGGPRGPPPPRARNGSFSSMGSQGSRGGGGFPPFAPRGRGGYGQGSPGRGGYPPRGGYARGGPNRGGPGGYGGQGRGGPMMGRGGMPRGPPPPGYNQQYFPGGPAQAPSNAGTYAGATMVGSEAVRNLSPPRRSLDHDQAPIGQAIEMDDKNGLPSPTHPHAMNFGLRDSDADVQGMIGMQQQRTSEDPRSASSVYSGAEDRPYVPARAAWHDPSSSTVPTASSLRTPTSASGGPASYQNFSNRSLSPIAHSPVSPQQQQQQQQPTLRNANSYYEDTDPAFAPPKHSTSPPPALQQQLHHHQGGEDASALPASLMPGPAQPQFRDTDYLPAPQTAVLLDRESSSSSPAEGARSPAASESSHYTSVSQRPVNPNWNPGYGQQGPGRAPSRQRGPGGGGEDVLLGGNPEFSLPGAGPGRGGRGGAAGMRRGGYGMQPVGRYPDAI